MDEDPISHGHFSNPSEVFVLAEHMGNALVHLGSKGVIHGNIKPSNIFRVEKKKEIIYKLADFGLAGLHDPLASWNSYTAPEIRVAMEKRQDPTKYYTADADIWSLGIVLLEMTVKSKPSTWGQTDGSDTEDEDTAENFCKHVAKKLHEVKRVDTELYCLISHTIQLTSRYSAQQLAATAKEEVDAEKNKRAEEQERREEAKKKSTPTKKKRAAAKKKKPTGEKPAGEQSERESSISTTDEDAHKPQDQQQENQMTPNPPGQPGPNDWDAETEVGSEDVEPMDVDMIDEVKNLKVQQYQTWADAWVQDGHRIAESYEHEMELEFDNFDIEDVEMIGGDANYPPW
jgi:serine/threonine protein kinase